MSDAWACPTCGKRTYSFLHSCPYAGMPHHWWVDGPTAIKDGDCHE